MKHSIIKSAAGIQGTDNAILRGAHGFSAIIFGALAGSVLRWAAVHLGFNANFFDYWFASNIDTNLTIHGILTAILAAGYISLTKSWRNSTALPRSNASPHSVSDGDGATISTDPDQMMTWEVITHTTLGEHGETANGNPLPPTT